jgi:hypothetical protein
MIRRIKFLTSENFQKKEFYDAQLHIGKHQCKSYVKDNVLDEITCHVESTYEQGAKGTKGIQVVVKQMLKLKEVRVGTNKMNYSNYYKTV